MAFLGKVYTFDRQENFDEYLKHMGVTDEKVIQQYAQMKATAQLKKEGDKYRYITYSVNGNNEVVFESGVEVNDVGMNGIPIKSTYTVDGNTVTQVVNSSMGSGTVIREFSDDLLKMSVTTLGWDGVAVRYYKA
ncbi:fatty acid-binding protein 1-like [Manduca sexta]|uniref:fatty acid-binding protein 1-like n=1 Tax=Manduca sexta TaxID=7130 RepID=UPI00118415AA|nr:fatty acid-binding protein 1-like [Manduca sexta]